MNFSHANRYLFKLFLGAVSKFSNELPRNFLGRNPREISTARRTVRFVIFVLITIKISYNILNCTIVCF